MCSTCPGGRPSAAHRPTPKNSSEKNMARVEDKDFTLCLYMHPNKGSHPVVGAAVFSERFLPNMVRVRGGFSINYGYRVGGGTERFLVHRADANAAPHWFKSVEELVSGVVNLPRRAAPAPPPPARIAPAPVPPDDARLSTAAALRDAVQSQEDVKREPTPEELLKAKAERPFDLQLVPGITTGIAQQMAADGVQSEADILALGVEGLQKYSGIGPAKAAIIIESLAGRET
jgi:hypothetical protein